MKKQNLTDGKHWIVTLDMPGGGFESYYVIWDTNPLEDSKFMLDYMTTWEDDYISNYRDYEEDIPDPDDFDSEEEYNQAYADWESNFISGITEEAELITQDIVNDYGEDYFNKQFWYD